MELTVINTKNMQKSDANQAPVATPVHNVQDLTKGGTSAIIDHRGQLYTLRITRAGKLILTK